MQIGIPDLVDVEQDYRKLDIVASSDINTTRSNRIPVLRQDRRLRAQQVFTNLLDGVQANWRAFSTDVNPSRIIPSGDFHSAE